MAISDGFIVICWMIVIYLLLLCFSGRRSLLQDLRKA